MLSRRQINVQRENLASMCRISVKSLLDYACLYTHVDDDCEEFINFSAVFEQLVSHRLRPYQKKVWLPGQGSPRHFWDVLLENCNRTRGFLFQSCIPNIEAIETFKSPKAKLRAFVRVALMEKRLSDYMFWLIDNTNLICESYLDGAIMTSEEAAVLCGDLIGLNAIDFNFCLKGNENELLGPLEISYGPFLKYKQTLASRCSDDIEMLRLRGKDSEEDVHSGSILTESNINDILRLQNLEKNINHIKEQKDYLEELVRLRERQIKEANNKFEDLKDERNLAEKNWERERRTMDACVLELQAELSKRQRQNESLKTQVTSLRQFKQRIQMSEVPLTDMAMGEDRDVDKPDLFVDMDHVEERLSMSHAATKKKSTLIPSDQRSIISLTSDQTTFQEDSQSLVPLTGSFADISLSLLGSETKDYPRYVTMATTQASLQSAGNMVDEKIIKETSTDEDVLNQNTEQMLPFQSIAELTEASTVKAENTVASEKFSRIEEESQKYNFEVYMTAATAEVGKENLQSFSDVDLAVTPSEIREDNFVDYSVVNTVLAPAEVGKDNLQSFSDVDLAVTPSEIREDNFVDYSVVNTVLAPAEVGKENLQSFSDVDLAVTPSETREENLYDYSVVNTTMTPAETAEDSKKNAEEDITVTKEENRKENSAADTVVSESYVVMEDVTMEIADSQQAQNLQNSGDTTDGSHVNVDSNEITVGPCNIMVTSGNSSSVESEKEEEGVMSEPEIVNPSNTSSDSNDATWEILSDSEHGDNRGEN